MLPQHAGPTLRIQSQQGIDPTPMEDYDGYQSNANEDENLLSTRITAEEQHRSKLQGTPPEQLDPCQMKQPKSSDQHSFKADLAR